MNLSNSQARYEVIGSVIMKTPCILTFCFVSVDQNFSVFMLLLQGVQRAALLTPCCRCPLCNRLAVAVAEFAYVLLLKELRIFLKPAVCTSPCLSTKLMRTAHMCRSDHVAKHRKRKKTWSCLFYPEDDSNIVFRIVRKFQRNNTAS